jgi:hypothetical protein
MKLPFVSSYLLAIYVFNTSIHGCGFCCLSIGRSHDSSIRAALAKLLARIAQLSLMLLEETSKNKHIRTIRSMPEVELFYTSLYENMPPQLLVHVDVEINSFAPKCPKR